MIGKILSTLFAVGVLSASHGYWLLAAPVLAVAVAGCIYFRPRKSTAAPHIDCCPTVQTARRSDLWVLIDPEEWLMIHFGHKIALRLNRLCATANLNGRPLRIAMDHEDDIFYVDRFNRATVVDAQDRPVRPIPMVEQMEVSHRHHTLVNNGPATFHEGNPFQRVVMGEFRSCGFQDALLIYKPSKEWDFIYIDGKKIRVVR
jgi:hypothetical protein